jgi:hypothetical protein
MAGKRKFVPESFKVILALASLAGTIGIWNNLAHNEMVKADTNEQPSQGYNLPPIPTLVELAQVNGTTITQAADIPQDPIVLRSVDMPVVSAPTQNPQGSVTVLNAPVTRTRSS